jgi:hypothetical protein
MGRQRCSLNMLSKTLLAVTGGIIALVGASTILIIWPVGGFSGHVFAVGVILIAVGLLISRARAVANFIAELLRSFI